MGKKKADKPTAKNGSPQVHAQKSVSNIAADLATSQLKNYVDQRLQTLGRQLQQETNQTLRALYIRLSTLEGIVQNEFKIDDSQLAELVADTEDKGSGLEKVEGEATNGDTLRITVSTKSKDQTEFQGTSKLLIDNLNQEPLTIGPQLEPHLLSMSVDDVKEVSFGEDNELIAKLEVNRISRKKVIETKQEIPNENAGE